MAELTHLDANGTARMVDVGGKPRTARTARARAVVRMVTEDKSLPRPFTIAFRAEDTPAAPPIFVVLREWSDSVRRRIGRS